MKLVINVFYLFLLLNIVLSNTNKGKNTNLSAVTNKVESTNKVETTIKNSSSLKSSIFESFKVFNVKTKQSKLSTDKTSFPANPFDPNSKPFNLSNIKGAVSSSDIFGPDGNVSLGAGPTYFKGWLKFFRYPNDQVQVVPKSFYENPEFTEQFKKFKSPDEIDSKKDGLNAHPQNKNEFYVTLFKNELSIARSLENSFQSVYDTLKIDYIAPVTEEPEIYTGGMENMGSFKEGECFKVNTNKAGKWTWVLCFKENTQKQELMSSLKKIIIYHQRQKGIIVSGGGKKPETPQENNKENPNSLSDITSTPENRKSPDGHWIILQDWSTCDKFCGGGTQTLHRLCVPPTEGGAPCTGESVIKKPCNPQPCPVDDRKIIKGEEEAKKLVNTLKPKLNVLPFSDRPQRYDKCHLKESDLLLTTSLQKESNGAKGMKVNAIQLPVRVVMNEHTISAYAGLKDTDKKVTFDIKKVNFYYSSRDPNCFEIREVGVKDTMNTKSELLSISPNKAEFCPFGVGGSSDIKDEWDYDFHLFKNQCHEEKKVSTAIDEKEIEDELNKKKDEMKIDLVNKNKKKILLNEATTISSHFKQIKESSLEAIKKEMKLEELIEQEIKEGQEDLIDEKKKDLEKERERLNCLNKAIKEKEIENEYAMDIASQEHRLEGIKQQVGDSIIHRRERLKAKIAKLKKFTEMRLGTMDTQIQNIRLEMVNSLGNEGNYNPDRCREIISSKNEIEYQVNRSKYCSEKMSNDPIDYNKCKDSNRADLIQLCCDYETDPNIPEDYKKCINETPVPKDAVNEDVRFFWGKPYHRNAIESMASNVSSGLEGGSFMNSSGIASIASNSMGSHSSSSSSSMSSSFSHSSSFSGSSSMMLGK